MSLTSEDAAQQPLPIPRVAGPAETEWDQGLCGDYAVALQQLHPGLRLGVIGVKQSYGFDAHHYFAHDENFAYDVTGAHPLPAYLARAGDLDVETGYSKVSSLPVGSPVVSSAETIAEAKQLILAHRADA